MAEMRLVQICMKRVVRGLSWLTPEDNTINAFKRGQG